MKNLYLILFACLLTFGVNAQSVKNMSNETFAFTSGDNEAFKVEFENVSKAQVADGLKQYLKNYKAKLTPVKGADSEYTVEAFEITDLKQKETTIKAQITELEGNATMYLNYNVGGSDITAEGSPSLFPGFKTFTTSIANKSVYLAFDDLLDAEKSVLKTKNKELKDLEKGESKEVENIANAKQSIAESENDINKLEGELKRQQGVVADKQKQVSDKENEIASVDIKTLEKSIKDIESDNGKIQKDIEKSNGEIAKLSGEITTEATALEDLDKNIAARKEVLAITADKKDLKEVKTLESDKAKQLGEVEKLRSEVGTIEAGIESKKAKIEANIVRIGEVRTQISNHNETAMKDQLKLLEKDLKEVTSVAKKFEKDIEKEQANIAKQEDKIRGAEAEIERLKAEQITKNTEIKTSEGAIGALEKTQLTFEN